jgi:predicted transcriptional regulator
MASRTTQRSALMSIRPQFASAILDGSKTVEFRKRVIANDVRRVIIYTTSPVQAVVGEFTIASQVVASPKALWRRFSRVAGIDRAAFFKYFDGSTDAVGIVIDSVVEYKTPRSLDEVEPGARPPQSFMYITAA